ncbi:MAG: hypothetical protein ACE5GO_02710 [Anaerolineales bacterium]
MGDRINHLFQEWGQLGAPVLFATAQESLPPRSLETIFAESIAYCRASGRLTWVVLDSLMRFIEEINVETLLRETRKFGNVSVLGLLSEAADQRSPHPKFKQIMRACSPNNELIPFFHRVAKSPLATRLARENGLALFRKWNYLSNELRYLSDELPVVE